MTMTLIDPAAIRRHLALLRGGKLAKGYIFQPIHDREKTRKEAWFVADASDATMARLEELQREGFGIFVTVNRTDGEGRSRENIKRSAPLIFADFDDMLAPTEWGDLGEPAFIVRRSATRFHAYWNAEASDDLDLWERAQRGVIARLGTDKAIHDPSRVMRLAGTTHLKGDPVRMVLEEGVLDAAALKLADIAVSPASPSPRLGGGTGGAVLQVPAVPLDNRWSFETAERFAAVEAEPAVEGDGGNARLFATAAEMKDIGVSLATAQRLLWRSFNPRCEPPWADKQRAEFMATVANGYRYAKGSRPGARHPAAAFADLTPDDLDGPGTSPPPLWYEAMNRDFALVEVEGQSAILSFERDEELERVTTVYRKPDSFKVARDHVRVNPTTDRREGRVVENPTARKIGMGSAWLRHPQRRTYDGLVFDPRLKAARSKLNLWQGFGVEPAAGEWPLLREYLRDVLCDGDDDEAFAYLLRWIAWKLQNVGEPSEVAVVLRGEKGAGKSTLPEHVLGPILGAAYFKTSRPDHVFGRFNGHLRSTALLHLEEAFWAGSKADDATLKDLITAREIAVEDKFLPVQTIRNHVALIMCANAEWVAPASLTERRYFVLDVSDRHVGDVAYWRSLHAELEGGGRAAFLADMLAMPDVRHPREGVPQTAALAAQKLETLSGVDRVLAEALESGDFPGAPFADEDGAGWADGELVFTQGRAKQRVVDAIKERMPVAETRHRMPQHKGVLAALKRLYGATDGKSNGERFWRIPRHADARAHFDKVFGVRDT